MIADTKSLYQMAVVVRHILSDGFRLVENDSLFAVVLQPRPRSLARRLFGRPWNPLRAIDHHAVAIASPQVIIAPEFEGGPVVIAHPQTAQALRDIAERVIKSKPINKRR